MTAFVALNNRSGQLRATGGTLDGVRAWLLAHFKRDERHFAQLLAARFTGVSLVLRVVSGRRLLVRARLYQAAMRVATIAFRLDPTAQAAHLSWTVVAPTSRGGNVLRHLLQNTLLIERDCGARRITLEAALTHGGYVWAVHGFLPQSDAEWARLAGRLGAKFEQVSAGFAPSEAAAVLRLLALPNRLAARAVAAVSLPCAGTTLGKHLLLGERWRGDLDFSDEASALIFLRRIGLLP